MAIRMVSSVVRSMHVMRGGALYDICVIYARELYDYIRTEYKQIAIIVGSTTIGRVGILSV